MNKRELIDVAEQGIWVVVEACYAESMTVKMKGRAEPLNVTLVGFGTFVKPQTGDRVLLRLHKKLIKHLKQGENIKLKMSPVEIIDGVLSLKLTEH